MTAAVKGGNKTLQSDFNGRSRRDQLQYSYYYVR